MLRALPPNTLLRSNTETANPRSINSCAALRPPTPPPRIAIVGDIVTSKLNGDSAVCGKLDERGNKRTLAHICVDEYPPRISRLSIDTLVQYKMSLKVGIDSNTR